MPVEVQCAGKARPSREATRTAAELRALLPRERLKRITAHSIGSRAALETELAAIRERGCRWNAR
ncbi:hypothetical protein JHV675_51670 [Mycobacterium avium subsp. hominissuis]